jgi:hypothetical protein
MTYTREADVKLFAQCTDALKPLTEQKRFGAVLVRF